MILWYEIFICNAVADRWRAREIDTGYERRSISDIYTVYGLVWSSGDVYEFLRRTCVQNEALIRTATVSEVAS